MIKLVCTNCGSDKLAFTSSGTPTFKCEECGEKFDLDGTDQEEC